MLRAGILFLVILVNLILQSTIFQYIALGGILPNTALILIVSYAILRGDVEGALFGFCAGLLQDMFFGHYIGLYALLGAMTGFVCGKPFKDFFRENYFLPVVLVFFSVLAYDFVFYVFSFLIYGRTEFLYYFQRIILPESIYTTGVSLLFYRIIYKINKRLEGYEQKRRGLFNKAP